MLGKGAFALFWKQGYHGNSLGSGLESIQPFVRLGPALGYPLPRCLRSGCEGTSGYSGLRRVEGGGGEGRRHSGCTFPPAPPQSAVCVTSL